MIYFDEQRIQMVLNTPTRSLQGYPHSKIIYKMLQRMYERQTSLEKTVEAALTDNDLGFNKYDANFLSSVARESKKYQRLTLAQTNAVAKTLKKYVRQLVEIANERQPEKAPVPIRKRKKTDLKQKEMFAA